jgi:hypothetical protein
MIEHLDPYSVANNARLNLDLYDVVVIVEGTADVSVYNRFFNQKLCVTIPAYGKENAIEALQILEVSNEKNILIIVDADFDHLDNHVYASTNLFLTDFHDMEMMIIASESFKKIIQMYGSPEKIAALDKSIKDIILDNSLPLGFFRWISSPTEDNLRLRFRDISFDRFVNYETLEIDLDAMINEVLCNSDNPNVEFERIKSEITRLCNESIDKLQVCSGKDVCQLLAIGFNSIFGKDCIINLTKTTIETKLRESYEFDCFNNSNLYKSIKDWEKNNNSKIIRN